MIQRLIRTVLSAVLIGLLLVGGVLADGETIPRNTVSSGGGTVSASGVSLRTVIGQPVAGAVGSDPILCSGLLCGTGVSAPPTPQPTPDEQLFLPIVQR